MASGDEFFTPDDSWAWFDEMKVRVHRTVWDPHSGHERTAVR